MNNDDDALLSLYFRSPVVVSVVISVSGYGLIINAIPGQQALGQESDQFGNQITQAIYARTVP